jgi:hypothetical protein
MKSRLNVLLACIMNKGSIKSEYPQVDLFCQELCSAKRRKIKKKKKKESNIFLKKKIILKDN